MYTFRSGDPFWLAGVADFEPKQRIIDIELFNYQGTNFLELVEEPISSSFGHIQLKLVNCDSLQASIEHDNQIFEFNMSRIANTAYKPYCLDPITR